MVFRLSMALPLTVRAGGSGLREEQRVASALAYASIGPARRGNALSLRRFDVRPGRALPPAAERVNRGPRHLLSTGSDETGFPCSWDGPRGPLAGSSAGGVRRAEQGARRLRQAPAGRPLARIGKPVVAAVNWRPRMGRGWGPCRGLAISPGFAAEGMPAFGTHGVEVGPVPLHGPWRPGLARGPAAGQRRAWHGRAPYRRSEGAGPSALVEPAWCRRRKRCRAPPQSCSEQLLQNKPTSRSAWARRAPSYATQYLPTSRSWMPLPPRFSLNCACSRAAEGIAAFLEKRSRISIVTE